jgi:hypothetical protein
MTSVSEPVSPAAAPLRLGDAREEPAVPSLLLPGAVVRPSGSSLPRRDGREGLADSPLSLRAAALGLGGSPLALRAAAPGLASSSLSPMMRERHRRRIGCARPAPRSPHGPELRERGAMIVSARWARSASASSSGTRPRANVRKHGVTFEEAVTVFLDELAVPFEQGEHSDRLILVHRRPCGIKSCRQRLAAAWDESSRSS